MLETPYDEEINIMGVDSDDRLVGSLERRSEEMSVDRTAGGAFPGDARISDRSEGALVGRSSNDSPPVENMRADSGTFLSCTFNFCPF